MTSSSEQARLTGAAEPGPLRGLAGAEVGAGAEVAGARGDGREPAVTRADGATHRVRPTPAAMVVVVVVAVVVESSFPEAR